MHASYTDTEIERKDVWYKAMNKWVEKKKKKKVCLFLPCHHARWLGRQGIVIYSPPFFFDFLLGGGAPSFFWCTTSLVHDSSLSHSNPARIGLSISSSAYGHKDCQLPRDIIYQWPRSNVQPRRSTTRQKAMEAKRTDTHLLLELLVDSVQRILDCDTL